jgi:hypothetical protein
VIHAIYSQPNVWDRFWAKVEVGLCWEWTAATNGCGYGWFRFEGRGRLAHRLAWEILVGPIPEGYDIDHLCRNTLCVNPDHLEPVTRSENLKRGHLPGGSANKAKAHCLRGHPFDAANTYVHRGKRHCKACQRRRNQEIRARKGGS